MKTLFNAAILIQFLMTLVYAFLVMATSDNGWAKLISWALSFVSFFIFGSILNYTRHNDIFKTIKELEHERLKYKSAKKKYLNAQIDKIEGI